MTDNNGFGASSVRVRVFECVWVEGWGVCVWGGGGSHVSYYNTIITHELLHDCTRPCYAGVGGGQTFNNIYYDLWHTCMFVNVTCACMRVCISLSELLTTLKIVSSLCYASPVPFWEILQFIFLYVFIRCLYLFIHFLLRLCLPSEWQRC